MILRALSVVYIFFVLTISSGANGQAIRGQSIISSLLNGFIRNTLMGITNMEEIARNAIPESSFTYKSENENVPKMNNYIKNRYMRDATLNFMELGLKYDYPVEEHFVASKDGYVLTVFRIPHGRKNVTIGPPVIMMHGFTDSSDTWIFPGPEYGLGYLVADAGFDVWFPNYRGNKYSRRHKYMDPDYSGKFWEFSYDEMAAYDLPAITDYILRYRQVDKLSYVGFSQGTTVFFAMSAHKPEYYDKFNIMVALAPVAWLTNLRNPHLRRLSEALPQVYALLSNFGVKEILSYRSVLTMSFDMICRNLGQNSTAMYVCRDLLFEIFGPDNDQFRYEMIPAIYGHIPCGASLQNTAHLGQGIRNKKFQRFNWGPRENLRRYGRETPPEYDVSSVKTPVALMFGKNDWLTSPVDIAKLKRRLPNVVDYYAVPRRKWQHSDHVWGKEAPSLIGQRMIKILHHYNSV